MKDQLAILLVVVFLVLLVFFLVRFNKPKINFITYPEFGIELPDNFDIHGIDVSKYQKNIAWDAVKSMKVKEIKIHFSFIKATEGENLVDTKFANNWAQAKKSQVARGAYHFFRANKDVDKQVAIFIKTVKLDVGDLPPVLDIETLDNTAPEKIRAKAKIWLDKIEAYYGVKPIIYTNAEFYNKYLGSDFDDYPLWVAHYFEQHRPRIQRNWHFWQHSDRGNVNGIDSKVDFNVFNGDSTDFENLLIKK
ncbi:MAG: glycoside hydrolase family 25 protein [Chitinophagaceae bacterium]|nr:MAG: glycoside hydrolase family 25 protein [Chitinophagaceae bacterium]